jgi:HD-like signal output (HDOD) protein
MNGQQHRPKRHPLIRLIRGILRLARHIFSSRRLNQNELAEIERARQERLEFKRLELERSRQQAAEQQVLAERERKFAERYITVGALLDRVEWKFPETVIDIPAAKKSEIRPLDLSRN